MKSYIDRDQPEKLTKDDNGQFVYAVCLSDIRSNILYSPYELRMVELNDLKHYNVYYTASATSVTRVGIQYPTEYSTDNFIINF